MSEFKGTNKIILMNKKKKKIEMTIVFNLLPFKYSI